MRRPRDNSKPGARFTFKPQLSTISSNEEPDFASLQSPRKNRPRLDKPTALRDIGSMVNERAPPKAPLQSTTPSDDNLQREKSPESDGDITALLSGFASLKGKVRAGMNDPFNPAGATSTPTFGHPTKIMSSRKQRADVFIRQKTRPEHHIDLTRVEGPRPPAFQDRRPPPMQMFNTMTAPAAHAAPSRAFGEEVFYTDPAKASADLKALLEGGMEDDEGEEEEAVKEVTPSTDREKKPQDTKKTAAAKDGSVEGLKVKLLPHQVEGVEWMRGRELGPVKRGRVPKGGILADDMGLGKTLQTISLILTNQKPEKGSPGYKKTFDGVEKTTLVVAPLALIRQWEAEIKDRVERSHGLKVCVHHGPQRTKRFKDLALYDVVITTFQILVSEHGHSSDDVGGVQAGCFGLHWWRVVLDEAHTIKNRNAKATKACYALRSEYRWCLSGTPMQNNLEELQSLVKFLRIRPYDDLKEWKAHIEQPMKSGRGHIAIKRLHSLLQCFMKRRTKEILKADGALNPGGKPSAKGEASTTGFKVTERKIVAVSTQLSPAERKFYNRLEARADRSLDVMMKGKVNYASALTLLLRLRQACNHPKLLQGKLEKDKDALSTDSSQKTQDADIDSLADMFGGMGIASRSCDICGRPLDTGSDKDICTECYDDLAYFNAHEKSERKKSKKKSKITKVVKEKVVQEQVGGKEAEEDDEPKQAARRARNRNAVLDSDDEEDTEPQKTAGQPRGRAIVIIDSEDEDDAVLSKPTRRLQNRNAVIDSDDEEAEGSWLVPEDQQGSVNLGKAGGEEDENAEGGGDSIGSEDSEDDESNLQDQSNLSSFIVDDEAARREKGYKSADESSVAEDSLLSVSALTKQMASQTLNDSPDVSKASVADSSVVSGSGSDESSSETDSGIDESELLSSDDESFHDPARQPSQILASAKIRELIKILHGEVQEHKFIVFSQFTSMLDLVEPFFRKEGFRFTRYDGSMKNEDREASLAKLRGDKSTRILLCSLKCGSLGLNLTAATRVVILEPFWNPVSFCPPL